MSDILFTEFTGRSVTIILHRPSQANAMNWDMLDAISSVFRDLAERDDVDVVVLQGAEGHFCSGWDVSHAVSTADEALLLNQRGQEMIEAVQQCPAVTVAALEGAVIGGGLLLAAACDIRIGTPSIKLCLPEVNFNVPVLWTGLSPLVREIGFSATRELAFTGRRYDAAWAIQRGLISECVDADALPATVESLIKRLDNGTGDALKTMKKDLIRLAAALMPAAHDYGAPKIVDSVMTSILAKHK